MTTNDMTQFSEATDIFISSLMFIGASPSSVGGGIRTTTFAIALLFLINFARGKEVINVFHRQIKLIDVFRSYAVILLAGIMVMTALLILIITEPGIPVVALLFEITSAFGTCGMSLGVTSELVNCRKSIDHGIDVHRACRTYIVPVYVRRENEDGTLSLPERTCHYRLIRNM